MPPSKAKKVTGEVGVQTATLASGSNNNLGIYIVIAALIIAAVLYFRGDSGSGRKDLKPDDEKKQVDPNPPNPKPDPEPVPVKKLEGVAIFLSPRAPMSPDDEKIINDAKAYRDSVTAQKFDVRSIDSEADKSETALKLIAKAKELGQSPPCVLFNPHSGSPRAVPWPKTSFEDLKKDLTK